jgi:hypothetical protein
MLFMTAGQLDRRFRAVDLNFSRISVIPVQSAV